MINIIVATPHGFCFGITKAIDIASNTSQNTKANIFFLGELVHNQHVVDWLETKYKIKTVQCLNDIPTGSIVIIRAHGASPDIFEQAKVKGLKIVDASCPLVLRSHQTVRQLTSQKKQIIFLCNKTDHDETVGVVGEAPRYITPVTLENIFDYSIDNPKNTIIMTQTTLSTIETKKAIDFIKNKYPQVTVLPHICQATTDRQKAIINLAKKYKFVIIVGSPTSANSNSLKSVAVSSGATAYIVDNATELKQGWFNNKKNVVLSSGASTPESVLNEVIEKIKKITHL